MVLLYTLDYSLKHILMNLHVINYSQRTELLKQIFALQIQMFYTTSFLIIKYLWMYGIVITGTV